MGGEAGELGMAPRGGVAGAVVEAMEAEDHTVAGQPLDRLDLGVVDRSRLRHRRVEVVTGDPGADRQQIRHAGLGEDGVEATEPVGPELATGVECPGVGKLVDPDQRSRLSLGRSPSAAPRASSIGSTMSRAQPARPRLNARACATLVGRAPRRLRNGSAAAARAPSATEDGGVGHSIRAVLRRWSGVTGGIIPHHG